MTNDCNEVTHDKRKIIIAIYLSLLSTIYYLIIALSHVVVFIISFHTHLISSHDATCFTTLLLYYFTIPSLITVITTATYIIILSF